MFFQKIQSLLQLLTDRVLIMPSCTCWKHVLWGPVAAGDLESIHTGVLKVSCGTLGGSTKQNLKDHLTEMPRWSRHLPTELTQITDTIWMLTPFLKTSLTWEGARISSEESPVRFPWDRLSRIHVFGVYDTKEFKQCNSCNVRVLVPNRNTTSSHVNQVCRTLCTT